MNCNCPDDSYILVEQEGEKICIKTTEILNIECPEGCEPVLNEAGGLTCDCVNTIDPTYDDYYEDIDLEDTRYFKEVSWTASYKPETGSWESYMSYLPNYYINHADYFQSGVNSSNEKNGLWSHLLSNKSYRVFYAQRFPYIIEYPIKNNYISKRLESMSWNAQLKRNHNDYDFSVIEENPFSAVTIYNNSENSGRLIPVLNNGTLSQLSKYPVTNKDNSQSVLLSYDNYRYNMNYFYNRTKSNRNNQPLWIGDENQINKNINPKAVSFYGKSTLERLKGDYFLVRLERDGNTNYDLDFKWSEQVTKPS